MTASNNFDGPALVDSSTDYFGFGRANGADGTLNYTTLANGGFTVGATVTGATSGAVGVVIAIKDNGSSLTGTLFLADPTRQEFQGAGQAVFANGENLQIAASTKGVASGTLNLVNADAKGVQARILYSDTDPNGVITAPQGSLLLKGQVNPILYVNTVGANTWLPVTDAGVLIADPGDGGAISVTRSGDVALAVAAGVGETRTLAAPPFLGEELTISIDTLGAGGTVAVTSATTINQANNTVMTAIAAQAAIFLKAVRVAGVNKWRVVATNGFTLS